VQIFPRFTVHTEAQTVFFKILIFLLKINFLYILNCFNTLILKIIFKNKKKYFNNFQYKNYFKTYPLPYFRIIFLKTEHA
jgi:hypothetical protein